MADKIKVVLADGTEITKSGFMWSTGSGLIVTDTKAGDRAMTALVAEVERLQARIIHSEFRFLGSVTLDLLHDPENAIYRAEVEMGAHATIVRERE